MDTNIIYILKDKLNLTHTEPSEKVGAEICLLELRFVLSDIAGKQKSIVGIRKYQSETDLQYITHPDSFVYDLGLFMPIIEENMENVGLTIVFNMLNMLSL